MLEPRHVTETQILFIENYFAPFEKYATRKLVNVRTRYQSREPAVILEIISIRVWQAVSIQTNILTDKIL